MKKIKIKKLTYQQYEGLLWALEEYVVRAQPSKETFLAGLVISKWHKRKHYRDIAVKTSYSLSMDIDVAVAFYIYFSNTAVEDEYAGLIIRNICNRIHQQL